MTAPIRSMPELIAGLRESVHERGVAFQTVDAIAGLPDRYTSKVLGPTPVKNIGPISLEGILGATGKALVLVDDPEQMKRVKGRWTPRKRPLKAPLLAVALSIDNLDAQIRERMRMLGSMGGKKGGSKGGKRRAKLMSHAARMRWSKEKRS